MPSSFLSHLEVVAKSPMALAAYIALLVVWTLSIWWGHQPQSKTEKILALFKSDQARSNAFEKLLGNNAPRGVAQMRYRSRILMLVAYLCTLLTAIVIVSIAMFRPASDQTHKPPILIDSQVIR